MKIQRIVVPIDFSEPCMKAVDAAVEWAHTFHASISLVHILDLTPSTRPGLEFALMDDRYHDIIEEDARKELQRLAARLDGVETTMVVRKGAPAPHIAAYAAEIGADLIVMATHGRSGFKRLILGSTTEEVVRMATCPVVCVHRKLVPLEPVAEVKAEAPAL